MEAFGPKVNSIFVHPFLLHTLVSKIPFMHLVLCISTARIIFASSAELYKKCIVLNIMSNVQY